MSVSMLKSFRAEVAGVLLIDSSSPYQIDELSGRRRSYEADKRVVTSFDGKIARGSEHAVHHGWLDVVITEMTLMIDYLRGVPAQPFESTITNRLPRATRDAARTPARQLLRVNSTLLIDMLVR
jgi:hypothetical protein